MKVLTEIQATEKQKLKQAVKSELDYKEYKTLESSHRRQVMPKKSSETNLKTYSKVSLDFKKRVIDVQSGQLLCL